MDRIQEINMELKRLSEERKRISRKIEELYLEKAKLLEEQQAQIEIKIIKPKRPRGQRISKKEELLSLLPADIRKMIEEVL